MEIYCELDERNVLLCFVHQNPSVTRKSFDVDVRSFYEGVLGAFNQFR